MVVETNSVLNPNNWPWCYNKMVKSNRSIGDFDATQRRHHPLNNRTKHWVVMRIGVIAVKPTFLKCNYIFTDAS